jgi:phosphatidylglycerophosphate synthase
MRELNFPNFLTFLRLLGAPYIPFSLVWSGHHRIDIFILAIFLACTDLVDGRLAKWMKQETALGKKLDPIADFSFCTALFVTVLLTYLSFPMLLFAWTVFALYFTFYARTVFHLRAHGSIDLPNMQAKAGMFILMISLLLVMAGTIFFPFFIWHMAAVVGVVISVLLTSGALKAYKRPLVSSTL